MPTKRSILRLYGVIWGYKGSRRMENQMAHQMDTGFTLGIYIGPRFLYQYRVLQIDGLGGPPTL